MAHPRGWRSAIVPPSTSTVEATTSPALIPNSKFRYSQVILIERTNHLLEVAGHHPYEGAGHADQNDDLFHDLYHRRDAPCLHLWVGTILDQVNDHAFRVVGLRVYPSCATSGYHPWCTCCVPVKLDCGEATEIRNSFPTLMKYMHCKLFSDHIEDFSTPRRGGGGGAPLEPGQSVIGVTTLVRGGAAGVVRAPRNGAVGS